MSLQTILKALTTILQFGTAIISLGIVFYNYKNKTVGLQVTKITSKNKSKAVRDDYSKNKSETNIDIRGNGNTVVVKEPTTDKTSKKLAAHSPSEETVKLLAIILIAFSFFAFLKFNDYMYIFLAITYIVIMLFIAFIPIKKKLFCCGLFLMYGIETKAGKNTNPPSARSYPVYALKL